MKQANPVVEYTGRDGLMIQSSPGAVTFLPPRRKRLLTFIGLTCTTGYAITIARAWFCEPGSWGLADHLMTVTYLTGGQIKYVSSCIYQQTDRQEHLRQSHNRSGTNNGNMRKWNNDFRGSKTTRDTDTDSSRQTSTLVETE